MLRILMICVAAGATTLACSSDSDSTATPEPSDTASTEPTQSASSPQPTTSATVQAKVRQLDVGASENLQGGEQVGSYDKKVVKLEACPDGPCMTASGPSLWRATGKAAGTTTVTIKGEQTTTSYQFIVSGK